MSKLTKQSKITSFVEYETEALKKGFRFSFGIDEAGRGPLAGPVVAAAVCLTSNDFKTRIDDSKKLSAAQRVKAFDEIFQKAYVGIGIVSEAAIDELNILNATFHAMDIAVNQLCHYLPKEQTVTDQFNKEVILLIDGNSFKTSLPFKHQTIVGGDRVCLSISCASIVAKVYRDRMMDNYHKIYPQYGFAKHKGYPTAGHRQAIAQYGLSRLHRKSFTLQ